MPYIFQNEYLGSGNISKQEDNMMKQMKEKSNGNGLIDRLKKKARGEYQGKTYMDPARERYLKKSVEE